jgi:hypothetical protein
VFARKEGGDAQGGEGEGEVVCCVRVSCVFVGFEFGFEFELRFVFGLREFFGGGTEFAAVCAAYISSGGSGGVGLAPGRREVDNGGR